MGPPNRVSAPAAEAAQRPGVEATTWCRRSRRGLAVRWRAVSAIFTHRLRVRYSECDPQGVVFNANYVTYFDIALTELWREAIGPYAEMMAGGADMVVAEARVRYLAPARFDDVLDVAIVPDPPRQHGDDHEHGDPPGRDARRNRRDAPRVRRHRPLA